MLPGCCLNVAWEATEAPHETPRQACCRRFHRTRRASDSGLIAPNLTATSGGSGAQEEKPDRARMRSRYRRYGFLASGACGRATAAPSRPRSRTGHGSPNTATARLMTSSEVKELDGVGHFRDGAARRRCCPSPARGRPLELYRGRGTDEAIDEVPLTSSRAGLAWPVSPATSSLRSALAARWPSTHSSSQPLSASVAASSPPRRPLAPRRSPPQRRNPRHVIPPTGHGVVETFQPMELPVSDNESDQRHQGC